MSVLIKVTLLSISYSDGLAMIAVCVIWTGGNESDPKG